MATMSKDEIDKLDALQDEIGAERLRQVAAEGYHWVHDEARNSAGELAMAAGCYALASARTDRGRLNPPTCWPWPATCWKPKDARRDLIRAGALILAELARLDRVKQ